jgi:hypothetical protein
LTAIRGIIVSHRAASFGREEDARATLIERSLRAVVIDRRDALDATPEMRHGEPTNSVLRELVRTVD